MKRTVGFKSLFRFKGLIQSQSGVSTWLNAYPNHIRYLEDQDKMLSINEVVAPIAVSNVY